MAYASHDTFVTMRERTTSTVNATVNHKVKLIKMHNKNFKSKFIFKKNYLGS